MDPNLLNRKYGIFPPIRTHAARAKDGSVLVAIYIPEGYSMEEWEANLPHAWAALEASLTPEQRAAISRGRADWPPPTEEERRAAQFARARLRRQRRSRRKRRRASPQVRRLGDDD